MEEEYTFVCIEEQELNRLKKIAYNFKSNTQNDSYNSVIDKISRIEKKALQQELFVYDLNGELKYFELELQRKYEEQLSKLDDFKLKCIELFKLQKDDYTRLIEEQNKKIDYILNKIKDGFNIENIFNDTGNKKDFAKNLCDDLNKIISKLNEIPNKELYLKDLNKIKYLFKQSLNDFEKGFYESSMSISRLVYSNILDFRNNFIESEEKIYNLSNVLNTKIEYLKENIKNNRNINFEYNNNYFNLDTSFWSNGLIDKINYKLNNLENIISENINIDILENNYKEINNYENQVSDIINKSKINIISSQIRANIANKCIDILTNSNFKILEYFYINNDLRNDFKIIFENILEDKFIIIIRTIDNSFNTKLIIELEEYSKDKDIKLYDIKKILSNNGIIISND